MINFTPVLELIKIAESRGHSFSQPSIKAVAVAGFVVIAASDGTIPVEMEINQLSKCARTAISEIVGDVANEILVQADFVVLQMFNDINQRKL